jgi:hypothetical protein
LSVSRRRSAGALLLLVASCSRAPGENAPRGDGSAPVTALPSVDAAAATTAMPGAGPILTPEDVEPETEHRITEQNLESELDRLEREIQAE